MEHHSFIREHIIFSGTVQGVGFRYRACCIAKDFGLTGYVKNLDDGNVEMEVQGAAQVIEKLLSRLEGERFICIEHLSRKNIPLEDEENFIIKNAYYY